MKSYDVVVIGGGPSGMGAALEAVSNNVKVLLIEREKSLGGILKQCIHDGFGLKKFDEVLTGCEYADRYIKKINDCDVEVLTKTFVTAIEKIDDMYEITYVNNNGVYSIFTKTIILACGCREKTAKQIGIHGNRPSRVYTAGTAQYFINILGYLPCKKCIILGSGDIGLIMARRLKLEGAEVLGVYEIKSNPSGLIRNIVQCLNDYNIPLYLSHTVTRIIGNDHVEAVEIAKVDKLMNIIPSSKKIIECDGVILSVGLIPENEIAEMLNIEIDKNTNGCVVDQDLMTSKEGVFCCGNALHVYDLVDYVSESGEVAGIAAVRYIKRNKMQKIISVNFQNDKFLYVVPQQINNNSENDKVIFYFRAKDIYKNIYVKISCDGEVIYKKLYKILRPPEMERIEVNIKKSPLNINITLEND